MVKKMYKRRYYVQHNINGGCSIEWPIYDRVEGIRIGYGIDKETANWIADSLNYCYSMSIYKEKCRKVLKSFKGNVL